MNRTDYFIDKSQMALAFSKTNIIRPEST